MVLVAQGFKHKAGEKQDEGKHTKNNSNGDMNSIHLQLLLWFFSLNVVHNVVIKIESLG